MRARAMLMVTLLAALMLAGCTTAPTETDTDTAGTVDAARADAGRYVPWTLSDFWVYDMDVRGFDRFSDTQLVYYEESGPEFVVGTPEYGEALYHAVFSVNPILGRVHKQLLSPHERGDHAHMFPFHLTDTIQDGQVWTTVFYERQLRLEASFDDRIPTPDGPRAGYRIQGTDPNSPFTIDYTYVPDVKWFTHLRAIDEDGQLVRLSLTGHGTGYSGDAHFIRGKDLFHGTLRSEGLVPVERTFQVTRDLVDRHRVEAFAISADIALTSGINAAIRILDPDGNTIYDRQYDDPSDGEFDIQLIWPDGQDSTEQALGNRPQWDTGTYTIRFTVSGEATAELHLVGTQDNSGSV